MKKFTRPFFHGKGTSDHYEIKKFTCPYCYGEHTLNDCKMKCSFERIISGKKYTCKEDIEKGAVDGSQNATKQNGWIPPTLNIQCSRCQEASKKYFCPMEEEENKGEIPYYFLSKESLPIALVGAPGSGKSCYITVLINEIRKKMTSQFECTLDLCCTKETEKSYAKYYEVLYMDGYTLASTDIEEIDPMIFPLEFTGKEKNMAVLTFYDTAGENFRLVAERIDRNNRYISNAKGIILLLDPLKIPFVRKRLKMPELTLDEEEVMPIKILNRVIDYIRNVKNLGIEKIDIPIALVFTKIDILEQSGLLPQDSWLREESQHLEQGGFVKSDFENTESEIEKILENWNEKEILNAIQVFSKSALFGVSSLGSNPNEGELFGAPNPWRVLDPLLWLLAENKYIETIGRR